MSHRIDGKKISEEIGQKLFLELQEKKIVGKISLGILCVGKDLASLTFINVKKKFGEKYGFQVNILQLPEPEFYKLEDYTGFKDEVVRQLRNLQSRNDAVIVQLPLPESLKIFTDEILSCVEKEKDVDNLNNGVFKAPIVLALENIFKEVGSISKEKVIGIVGLGAVVGQPIYKYLESEGYKVMKISRSTFSYIHKCDVVISGVGSPFLIKKEDIKSGAVLIDYGCSYAGIDGTQKMCGDFDSECFSKASFYTPVPGCMGPLVVASLFENVLKSKYLLPNY
jgi:methylenetetrahydrofolate dehydrogenase (NADP+)/methenyltetrahydrofolate cyclohydrolase